MNESSGLLRSSGFEYQRGFALSLGEAVFIFSIDVSTFESLTVYVGQWPTGDGTSAAGLCRTLFVSRASLVKSS